MNHNNHNKLIELSYPIVGMHCASCASTIKRKIENLEGVESCQVNYGTEKAKVSFDPKKVSIDNMNDAINKYGYSIREEDMNMLNGHNMPSGHEGHMMTPVSSDQTMKDHKLKELEILRKYVLTIMPMVFVSIFVMGWEISSETLKLTPEMPEIIMEFFHHLLPLFATYALFVVGVPYLKGMFRFFKYRVADMDSLVGIGTSVAFLFSFIVTAFEEVLAPFLNVDQNYYDITIVVIGFITLGKYLESRSKLKTGEAVESLLNLQAKNATVLRQGKEIIVSIDEIEVSDIVLVKPGQAIPLDGTITKGSSSIDESMISGEPIPVDKREGDLVIGGTINKQGSLQVKVTKVGKDTMLSQIINMVEEAQGSKAPIERLADKISEVFVPIVMVLAFITFILWVFVGSQFMPFPEALRIAILSFVGILVIACPCAMGLATPTAIIVGVGKAAQNGILIKNAESLEKLSSVNYIVLDKTGTLTKGAPELTDIIPVNSLPEREILGLLASLESNSEHPLAIAIINKAKEGKVTLKEVTNFEAIEGKGLKGKINGELYFAGNAKLAEDLKLNGDDTIQRLASQGKTPILLMDENQIIAYIGVSDTLKEDAKRVVVNLHKLGLKVAMLTGDNKNTANYIASQINIDQVLAEVLPQDKAQEIKKLQSKGHKVAMVGDGINDAPALATAEVGVAMATGTDVAIESAGITLLGGHLSKLPKAFKLAKSTMSVIKQNLFWAFFYNVISVPIAAGVLYPFWKILLNPAIAGAAMGFSSVSVVLNSLRLKTSKI